MWKGSETEFSSVMSLFFLEQVLLKTSIIRKIVRVSRLSVSVPTGDPGSLCVSRNMGKLRKHTRRDLGLNLLENGNKNR